MHTCNYARRIQLGWRYELNQSRRNTNGPSGRMKGSGALQRRVLSSLYYPPLGTSLVFVLYLCDEVAAREGEATAHFARQYCESTHGGNDSQTTSHEATEHPGIPKPSTLTRGTIHSAVSFHLRPLGIARGFRLRVLCCFAYPQHFCCRLCCASACFPSTKFEFKEKQILTSACYLRCSVQMLLEHRHVSIWTRTG